MNLKTSFEEFQPLNGFDESVHPHWQMVPLDGEKNVYLNGADGMILQMTNPKIADFTEIASDNVPGQRKRLFKITGKSYGQTYLEVRKGDVVVTKLEISVKNSKKIGLSFNFVTDKTGRTTTKNSSKMPVWTELLNNIYLPQTNISFVLRNVRQVTINHNLGSEVDSVDTKESDWEWKAVVKERDAGADINIFFVWKLNQGSAKQAFFPKGLTGEKDCLISDYKATSVGLEIIAIAHEIGHALGIPAEQHFYAPQNKGKFVMYHSSKLSGPKLPKVHANLVNP